MLLFAQSILRHSSILITGLEESLVRAYLVSAMYLSLNDAAHWQLVCSPVADALSLAL